MIDRGFRGAGAKTAALIAGAAALLFLILGARFAQAQNVWIDESTQLLGSGLPLGRLFSWLAGRFEPLGVPGDRMPPVSYIADALCGRTLCGTVTAYRLLHALIAAAGVGGLVLLVARRYGWIGAVASGAFLALAPQMLTTGVEIRAYPIFFAVTVLQLWLLYRLIDSAPLSPPRLLAFALAGVLAIYTHFFGVISSSALFTGLIAARARNWGDLIRIGSAWAIVLLSAAGIAPFVMGATAISTGVENGGAPGLGDIATYLLRVIGHSSMMLHPWLTAIFGVGLATLLALGLLSQARLAAAEPRATAEPAFAVGVALIAGVGVTILAAFVIHGFNPLKPSYSIWTVPLIALLAGAGAARIDALSPLAWLAAAAMVAAIVPLTITFERHADWFVHGPERAIAAEVGDAPERTAIVYLGDDWAYAYFPMIYRYQGRLGQYRIDAQGALHAIGAGGDPAPGPIPMATLRRYDRLLLVSIALRSYRELHAYEQGYLGPVDTQPIGGDVLGAGAGAWISAKAVISPGLYWLRMTRLQRTDTP